MATDELTFQSWWRDPSAATATDTSHGRLVIDVAVTLQETTLARDFVNTTEGHIGRGLALAGPADVTGLDPAAIVRRFPTPGTLDMETTKLPFVEFADPYLPWRYTPEVVPDPATNLAPWLALVVVRDDESEVRLEDGTAVLMSAVTEEFELEDSHLWAHVQHTAPGQVSSRAMSGRRFEAGALTENQAYIALLVPTFVLREAREASEGGHVVHAWERGQEPYLPVYDLFRFRTARIPGDFKSLASALRPGEAA